jgi:putative hydrolase of the HAD superfamily
LSKFVYFDLGNVLINFDHQIAASRLAQLANCSVEQIEKTMFESDLQNRYETGLVNSHEFAREINSSLDASIPESEVLEAVSAIFELNEPIISVLAYLRDLKVPMAILSNTCEAHWNWILKQAWPIPSDWFEFHVLSYEVQSMKPDSKIYEVCENRAGRKPADIFFTDDRPENIAAAQSRGWETHRFESANKLDEHLRRWLS